MKSKPATVSEEVVGDRIKYHLIVMKKICTYDKTIEDDIVESTVESLVCVDGESSGSGLPTAPIVEIGFRRHSLGVLLVALVVVPDRASQPTRSPNE